MLLERSQTYSELIHPSNITKFLTALTALFSFGCAVSGEYLHPDSKLPAWIATDPEVKKMKMPLDVKFVIYTYKSPQPYSPSLTRPAHVYVDSSTGIGRKRVFKGVCATRLPEGTRFSDDTLTVYIVNGIISKFRTELTDNTRTDELLIDKVKALYLVSEHRE